MSIKNRVTGFDDLTDSDAVRGEFGVGAGHDHAGTYSPTGHLHDGTYAASDHGHGDVGAWMPLSSVVDGDPVLVWSGNDLIPTRSST